MAETLTNELFTNKGGRSTALITFQRDGGFTDTDRKYAIEVEDYLNDHRKSLEIQEIISPFSNKNLESELLSKDKNAAIMSISLSIGTYTQKATSIISSFKNVINHTEATVNNIIPVKPAGLSLHLTGDATMNQEEKVNVDKSMDLTVKITLILVALILLIIYRSPFAPLISLLSIGISFAVSKGLIAIFADMGLKVSAFTETFLIAVLFGAGTDYCLLIISRYKEELLNGSDSKTSILTAMRGTGVAVLSSGGTVVIGFCFMIFAKFGLYNSTGPSVAIGVTITLFAVLTLVPAVIAVLGEKIFWPKKFIGKIHKKTIGHSIWSHIAKKVSKNPVRFIVIPLLIFTPFIIASAFIKPSYDQLSELPAYSEARQGFDVIKKHFNQGEMLPIKIVMKTDKNLWTNDSLQLIDKIADNLTRVKNVAKVRTATRPLGEKLSAVSLPNQIKQLSNGLGAIGAGFTPLETGLNTIQTNINKISKGLKTGGSQIGTLADATGKVADGVIGISDGINKLQDGSSQAAGGLGQISQNIDSLKQGITQSKDGINTVSANLTTAKSSLDALLQEKPELNSNTNFQTAYGIISGVAANTTAIVDGLTQLEGGMTNLKDAINSIKTGVSGINNGLGKTNEALIKIEETLETLKKGQESAGSQLKLAAEGLTKIADGLESGKSAINDMGSGVTGIEDAAGDYTSEDSTLNNLFYLPAGTLTKYPELKTAMNNYISPNGKGMVIDVVLNVGPFSEKALDTVDEINRVVTESIRKTSFDGSEFHTGGATAVFNSIREVTASDFRLVMIIVLAGIFLVLVLLLRSLISPIYIILTIVLSYFTTLGITYFVFQVLMGNEGLNWAVQFFVFCILVALGVDYNIFLMSRVKEEYRPNDIKRGVTRALINTGAIITSCGIIMAGTFGAMMASPIKSLVQIGFATVIGLLIDTFIVRTLIVPAIAIKIGVMNWWPGEKIKIIHVEKKNETNVNPDEKSDAISK
jgi:RND superfamily putative drug exporter